MSDIEKPAGNRPIARLVVHCSATPPGMNIGVDTIRRWHVKKGWSDVGYHVIVRRDGKPEAGRDVRKAGAHARGFNADSIGLCLIGGIGEDGQPEANFTLDQLDTLRVILEAWKASYPDAEIIGHGDLPGAGKACPCFAVAHWWEAAEVVPVRGARLPALS